MEGHGASPACSKTGSKAHTDTHSNFTRSWRSSHPLLKSSCDESNGAHHGSCHCTTHPPTALFCVPWMWVDGWGYVGFQELKAPRIECSQCCISTQNTLCAKHTMQVLLPIGTPRIRVNAVPGPPASPAGWVNKEPVLHTGCWDTALPGRNLPSFPPHTTSNQPKPKGTNKHSLCAAGRLSLNHLQPARAEFKPASPAWASAPQLSRAHMACESKD